jgi:YegS/Rv2252/BmrU family lipid kinase
MTANLFFVVNPRAGAGRARETWNGLEPALRRAGVTFEYELTQGPETATSFVRQALRQGVQTIVAVGGDGTVHEAANGFFLGPDLLAPEASLGVVPCGSTNDFARGLNLPMGNVAIDAVLHGQTVQVDVGRAHFMDAAGRQMTRHFVNGADLGVGTRSALDGAAQRMPGGLVRQALTALISLPRPDPWHARIAIDEEPPEELSVMSAIIGLGPFGNGGMELLPGAKMDDGRFDVLIIKLPGPSALQRAFGREVRVETDGRPFLQLDGEAVGAGPATFELLPGALKVHIPR